VAVDEVSCRPVYRPSQLNCWYPVPLTEMIRGSGSDAGGRGEVGLLDRFPRQADGRARAAMSARTWRGAYRGCEPARAYGHKQQFQPHVTMALGIREPGQGGP